MPISPRDGRERVLWALEGVSLELAALPWAWNPSRTPREAKLMIRGQERRSEAQWAWIMAKHEFLAPRFVFVDAPLDPSVLRRGGPY